MLEIGQFLFNRLFFVVTWNEYFIGQNLYKVAQSYLDAVFVIPGIMGSHLDDTVKKDRLWLDLIGMAAGQLKKLKIIIFY